MNAAGRTDTGRLRKNNEDAILLLPQDGIFCVADGMGGAAGGEVASRTVLAHIANAFCPAGNPRSLDQKASLVRETTKVASEEILRWAQAHSTRGTGTTLVALAIDSAHHQAITLHAGDSRAYLFRKGRLQQITKDHTLSEALEFADEKHLSNALRHIITNAVGLHPHPELELIHTNIKAGDLFLLCSDGLTGMLSDIQIVSILLGRENTDLQTTVDDLVAAANEAGGTDNISAILIRPIDTTPSFSLLQRLRWFRNI